MVEDDYVLSILKWEVFLSNIAHFDSKKNIICPRDTNIQYALAFRDSLNMQLPERDLTGT